MECSSLSCTPFCYRQESCSVGKSLQPAVSVEHDFKEHDVSATFIDMTSVFDFFKNHGASGNGRRPICCELQEALQGCLLFAEVYRHSGHARGLTSVLRPLHVIPVREVCLKTEEIVSDCKPDVGPGTLSHDFDFVSKGFVGKKILAGSSDAFDLDIDGF